MWVAPDSDGPVREFVSGRIRLCRRVTSVQVFGQAILEQDREVVQGVFPFWNRLGPLLRGLANRHENQLQSGVAVRVILAVPSAVSVSWGANGAVDRLDRVRRVGRFTDRREAGRTSR